MVTVARYYDNTLGNECEKLGVQNKYNNRKPMQDSICTNAFSKALCESSFVFIAMPVKLFANAD
jgi:hypothetical protein